MNGYIKIHRKLKEWGWYKDVNTKVVFLELLIRANYKDGEFKGVLIKAGQAVFGRKELAETVGLSEQNVTTAISHLKSTNDITIKSNNRFSVATITNWAFYQLDDSQVNNEVNSELNNNQTTTKQQLNTSKKERRIRKKEYKKIKENIRESSCMDNDHQNFAAIKLRLMKGD